MSAENITQRKSAGGKVEMGAMERLLSKRPEKATGVSSMERLLGQRRPATAGAESMEKLLSRRRVSSGAEKMQKLLKERSAPTSGTEKMQKLLKEAPAPETGEKKMRKLLEPEAEEGLEIVGEVLDEVGPPTTDTGNVAATLGRRYVPRETRAREIVDGLTKEDTRGAYETVSAWLTTWWRPILYNIALGAMLYLGGTLIAMYLFSGSLSMLLGMLQYLGVSVIPAAIWEGIRTAGIGGITTLSRYSITKTINVLKKTERGRRILNQKVSDGYLKSALGRLGVDTRDLRRDTIATEVLSLGVNGTMQFFTGGGPAGFLISAGIGYGTSFTGAAWRQLSKPSARKKPVSRPPRQTRRPPASAMKARHEAEAVAEELAEAADRVVDTVVGGVLDGPKGESVVEDVMEEIDRTEPKRSKARRAEAKTVEEYPEETEVTNPVMEAIANNRKLAFFGAVTVGVVGLAFAGDATGLNAIIKESVSAYGPDAVAKLGELAWSLSESEIARVTVTNLLLEKIGVNKLVDLFADKLTPAQRRELKSLAAQIRAEKKKSAISAFTDRFLAILSGGPYRSAGELKRMKKGSLQKLYRELNPEDRRWKSYTPGQLRDLIAREQSIRIQRMNSLVKHAVATTAKTVTATVAYKSAVEGHAYIKNAVETERLLQEKIRAETIAQAEREAEAVERARVAAEKAAKEARIAEAKAAEEARIAEERARAEAELEEGLRQRKIAEAEAREFKEQIRAQRRAEAKAKAAEARAEKEARKEAAKLAKAGRHQAALERLEVRKAARQLREAARAEELARKMDVTWVTETGESHPIPVASLLAPQALWDALDFEITPLLQKITQETAKTATHWIPGVGWVQGTIDKINLGLDVAETAKDLGKVAEVLTRLEMGESGLEIDPTLGTLDPLLKHRIPGINTAIENLVKFDKINMAEEGLKIFREGYVKKWDTSKLFIEFGKKLLVGNADLSPDVVGQIGETGMRQLFGDNFRATFGIEEL